MRSTSAVPARLALCVAAIAAGGCGGDQSSLHPAGVEAATIAQLFWIMAIGAALVWAAVVGIALYAGFLRPRPHGRGTSRWVIFAGGVVVPTLVLGALLLYGLVLMPQLRQPAGHRLPVWRARANRPSPATAGAPATPSGAPRPAAWPVRT